MVLFRFPTDEATVTREQSDLIIVSYHRLTDLFCHPSVAAQKRFFRRVDLPKIGLTFYNISLMFAALKTSQSNAGGRGCQGTATIIKRSRHRGARGQGGALVKVVDLLYKHMTPLNVFGC